MMLVKAQYKTLANFFNDIAKGYFLGPIAGNVVLATTNFFTRMLFTFFWMAASLLFLYVALIFSKESENDRNK